MNALSFKLCINDPAVIKDNLNMLQDFHVIHSQGVEIIKMLQDFYATLSQDVDIIKVLQDFYATHSQDVEIIRCYRIFMLLSARMLTS